MSWEPREPAYGLMLRRAVGLERHETPAVVWSCAHFFFLMAGYYVLRPIRDAMWLTVGSSGRSWLFLLTLAVMLVANPLFSALVSRSPRRVFVPTVYCFFVFNLLVFFALFRRTRGPDDVHLAQAFFVWVSVFNLFITSVFWGVMADLFSSEQGQRLFGLIGVGGTLGSIAGATSTAVLAERIGEINLLPVSAGLLGVASLCAIRTDQLRDLPWPRRDGPWDQKLGGSVLSGMTHVVRSCYLMSIVAFIFFHSLTGTFGYFVQGIIVERSLADRDARTSFFAYMDVLGNVLSGTVQVFLTGRIIKILGLGWALALLPLAVIGGFLALGLMPILSMLFAYQVLTRATEFALSRPARESLFTVLPREDKYKAKNFIDTFVYRGGDALGAIAFVVLTSPGLGLGLPGVLNIAAAAAIGWLPVALYLGRRYEASQGRAV